MKAIKLKDVKKGEYFILTEKPKLNEDGHVSSKYVRVRDDYERTCRRYWVYKYDDINDYMLMKGDRIVYTDFFF